MGLLRLVEEEIEIARRSGESLDDWCTRVVRECADARREVNDLRQQAETGEQTLESERRLSVAEQRLQASQAEVLLAFEAWRLQLPKEQQAADDPAAVEQDTGLNAVSLLTADQIDDASTLPTTLDDVISTSDPELLVRAMLIIFRRLLRRTAAAERSSPLDLLQQLAADIVG